MLFACDRYTREKNIACAKKKKYKKSVARGAVSAEIGFVPDPLNLTQVILP